MSTELSKLKLRSGQIKGKLTRFQTYLNDFQLNTGNLSQLETRLENINDILTEFESVQAEIEAASSQEKTLDEQASSKEREAFEDKYFEAISQAKTILKTHSTPPVLVRTNNVSSESGPSSCAPKLPALKIPEFFGLYSQWQSFYETFSALVHNNENLRNIEKFYYLQGSLKGEAAQVITSLPVSDANYSKAFKLLSDRYANRKAIVNAHLREIFELPLISKGSHSTLRKMLDTFLTNFRALESLKEPVDQWSTILIYLLVAKLDFHSRKEWENHSKRIDEPSLDDFITFLNQQCNMLESLYGKTINVNRHNVNSKTFYTNQEIDKKRSCQLCDQNHPIYFCKAFKDLSLEGRHAEVKKWKLCSNCLRTGHKQMECKSKGCRVCNKRHNTQLHEFHRNKTDLNESPNHNTVGSNVHMIHSEPNSADTVDHREIENIENINLYSHKSAQSSVLLSTALVDIVLPSCNEQFTARVLLDSGSQSNFITKSLVEKLNLPTRKTKVPICGIDQIKTTISEETYICLSSKRMEFKTKIQCLVIEKITDSSPQESFEISSLNIPELPLADPEFNLARRIDILIGCSLFFDLLLSGHIKLGNGLPTLQNSKLGWIVAGNVPKVQRKSHNFLLLSEEDSLKALIERFWRIEEISKEKNCLLSSEEKECEAQFQKTISRNSEGRFIVKLPLRENLWELGDSEHLALKRLYSLEQRLSKNRGLKVEYTKFLKEYESLSHMREISRNETSITPIYYLPHHCVIKPESSTTKLRVVFNASAKTTSNISLNDVLLDGPVLQNDLFSILTRFRKHEVVLIGDLTKMYRQILIHPDHVNLQRIVWRENPNQKVKHFALSTLTYGTKPASYLATRCLKQISLERRNEYPQECDIIAKDMYMDDVLTGAASVEELTNILQNMSRLLSEYKFEIRKFQSSQSEVLQNLRSTSEDKYVISEDTSAKPLGVSWLPSSDVFQYKEEVFQGSEPTVITKRNMLSFIAKIFDPLGLLGPIVIRFKILMQLLWERKLEWDEEIPPDIHTIWIELRAQQAEIHEIIIPRHVLINYPTNIQIHAFSDSSEKAYGCAIYLRSVNKNREIVTRLLCAKSRVAPLKTICVPRLELCGALLLARLVKKCLEVIELSVNELYLYTDSTIVLSWLACEPRTWKNFVANRVSEIQQLTSADKWHYISSDQNPADILSRGSRFKDLGSSSLWWSGPPFLSRPESEWPSLTHISNYSRNPASIAEYKVPKPACLINTDWQDFDIFGRYSSYSKLIRVVAYCTRFIKNSRASRMFSQKIVGGLTSKELDSSLILLVKLVQSDAFPLDLDRLKQDRAVRTTSNLKSLSPILTSDGLVRVGGRLENSRISFDQRHPIILPSKHNFTKLLIRHEHHRCLHGGVNTTLSHIRQKFWPVHGKSAVKNCVRNCIKCFRANPPSLATKMGQLPTSRVNPAPPFLHSAVDFAGPFDLKDSKLRNRKTIKGYLCIFVCLSTKAIHIELVSDLSSEGFLSMLKRFVSRRGICSDLYSDNATNFVGANNELKAIQNITRSDEFSDYLLGNKIDWHFIPARSPHFGGLWEAAVKSCKHHLKRVVGGQLLTYEEFYSVLTQVEAVLNSRPIVALSTTPEELEVLTPAHFLIGRPLTAVPQAELYDAKVNHLKRYRLMQQMVQSFWSRWVQEYLHTLQQRTKWQFQKDPEVTVGALVLLKEDHVPPLCWLMGRIVKLYPGRDNIVRVVKVKTKCSVLKRSVAKLCLLPQQE